MKVYLLKTDTVPDLWYRFSGDDLPKTILVKDFRPGINFKGTGCLYYLPEYQGAIEDFLYELPYRDSTILNYYKAEELLKRVAFLENFLSFRRSQRANKRIIETEPNVIYIALNNRLDEAIVRYGMNQHGCNALYRKENNKWKLVYSMWNLVH
jgi:hypothetical protein